MALPEASPPHRIVSLVPSHTQSLHDLGLAERVVGRTRFCILPEGCVETVPVVGGTKDAKLERILAQEPDLVVVDKDENPLALVEQLREAGIEVLHSEIDTVEDAATFLQRLGERCGVPTAGRAARAAIEATLAQVQPGPGEEALPVFCPIWYDPWMTFDATAYPHAMLEAVGLRNVFADHEGTKYFEVAPEEVAGSGAAWTLLPTEPFPFHKQRDRVDTVPLGVAGGDGRVHVIDGEALTWFGTHTVRGLQELARVAKALRGPGSEEKRR
ncbi:MAG: ABC transporter substrate-binding protein [Thermoplasmatota archaeon]